MSRTMAISEDLLAYIERLAAREHPALEHCRRDTAALPNAEMQIGRDQGAFMALIARLMGARSYLEIGTFTGYSALAVALALPRTGKVVCCDVSQKYTDMARGYWQEAGVDSMIDLRLGPALDTLDSMIARGEGGFDFAFIDADKPNYDNYYERVLKLLRPGGLVALDNMLWSGAVADPKATDPFTVAIRTLNEKVHQDERVDMTLAAIGDGVLMARKRQAS